jgi:hypothetical protein
LQGTCHENDVSTFSANSTVTFTASLSTVGNCTGASLTVNGAAQAIITGMLQVTLKKNITNQGLPYGTMQDWKAYASGQLTANSNGVTVSDTGNLQAGSNCTNGTSVGGGFSGANPGVNVGWSGACNTAALVYVDTTTSQSMSANNTQLSPVTFTCTAGNTSCGGVLTASTISNKMNTDVISAVPAAVIPLSIITEWDLVASAQAYEAGACILGKLYPGSANITCPQGVTCSANVQAGGASFSTGGGPSCSF